MSFPGKPILSLDFDGVIHDYHRGWQNGVIYGFITPGFFEWAKKAEEHFSLVIYSSRSKSPEGIAAMKDWLQGQFSTWLLARGGMASPPQFEFALAKPPAFLTIDDRALQFAGSWEDFEPSRLLTFRPWNT